MHQIIMKKIAFVICVFSPSHILLPFLKLFSVNTFSKFTHFSIESNTNIIVNPVSNTLTNWREVRGFCPTLCEVYNNYT